MRPRRSLHKITHVTPPSSERELLSGFSQGVFVLVATLFFVVGGLYLYSVNKSSVQGYTMRTLEKEIQELHKENSELRVREAEARSLAKVESGSMTLRMEKISTSDILILSNTVALR